MDAEFYAFVRYLKKHLPAPNGKPIYVKTRLMKTVCATVVSDRKSHRITVSNDLDQFSSIDALCHEWAHVLDFKGVNEGREEHRQSWGRQYAKVYQHYRRFREGLEGQDH